MRLKPSFWVILSLNQTKNIDIPTLKIKKYGHAVIADTHTQSPNFAKYFI